MPLSRLSAAAALPIDETWQQPYVPNIVDRTECVGGIGGRETRDDDRHPKSDPNTVIARVTCRRWAMGWLFVMKEQMWQGTVAPVELAEGGR